MVLQLELKSDFSNVHIVGSISKLEQKLKNRIVHVMMKFEQN
jgi:hypothetical protein